MTSNVNKYDFELELNTGNSLALILESVKPGSKVLEFGPAKGRMTRYLRQTLNCEVAIVEIDEDAYNSASQYAQWSCCGDIETFEWAHSFQGLKFDYVILADVLEHLHDPGALLRCVRDFLRPEGELLLSVPNIAHFSIIEGLLEDRFEYGPTGLLDEGHIKFFTRRSLARTLKDAGFAVLCEQSVYSNIPLDEAPANITQETMNILARNPLANNYQYVFHAIKEEYRKKLKGDFKPQNQIKRGVITEVCVLHIDSGFDFGERQKLYSEWNANAENYFCAEFDLSEWSHIIGIRFDLVGKSQSQVRIHGIWDTQEAVMIQPGNSIVTLSSGAHVFLDGTPEFYVTGDFRHSKLKIYGTVEKIDLKSLHHAIAVNYTAYEEQKHGLGMVIEKQNDENGRLAGQNLELAAGVNRLASVNEKLQFMLTDERDKYTEKIDGLNRTLEEQRCENNSYVEKIGGLKRMLEEQRRENNNLATDVNQLREIAEEQQRRIVDRQAVIDQQKAAIEASETLQTMIYRSHSWRITKPLRTVSILLKKTVTVPSRMKVLKRAALVFRALRNVKDKKHLVANVLWVYRRNGLVGVKAKILKLANPASPVQSAVSVGSSIDMAIFHEQQNELSESEMRKIIAGFAVRPLISVIMPVYNVRIDLLESALESVIGQTYDNWELCAVDDCSTDEAVRDTLSRYANRDGRIKADFSEKNGGISAASNRALEMASGEYIALVDNDDAITPDAFFWFVREINTHPTTDFLYSDECKMRDAPGMDLFEFFFKPDWSPETLMGFMYTGHLTMYRTALVRAVGGFRSRYDTAQDYDLALRLSERTQCVRHVERVLYLWKAVDGSVAKGGKQRSANIGVEAGADMMKRRGKRVIATLRPYGAHYKAVIPTQPLVSVIIAGNSENNLTHMLHSLTDRTSYINYELIVSCSIGFSKLQREFAHLSNIRWLQCGTDTVYAEQCNKGATLAEGEFLIFCQDFLLFKQPEWLEEIVGLMELSPLTAAISPKVVRADDTIQYAGMVTGTVDLVGIPFNGHSKESYDDYYTRHRWIRDVSVLSASCLAIRRSVFEKIDGFDAHNTPDKYSNADISFKVRELDLKCVYQCHAEVINAFGYGNDGWFGFDTPHNRGAYLLKTWGHYLCRDPYFTDSMKRTMLRELPYQFKIHYDGAQDKRTQKCVLLFIHELSLTGAPIVTHQAARLLKDEGYFPVIMAELDGPLREEIVRDGIMVVTHIWYFDERFFLGLAKSFDLVICSTICTNVTLNMLNGTDVPVLWWIHESEESYAPTMLAELPKRLSGNVRVYCGGNYSKSVLRRYRAYEPVEILLYGVEDSCSGSTPSLNRNGPVTFALVGTVQYRKGQDVFCRAIELMPEEVRGKCVFYIIGRNCDDALFQTVRECKNKFPDEVMLLDEMPRDQLMAIYDRSDAIVCASRDDPMPVVATEGMMWSKICICSEHSGTASLIRDGENGFVYRDDDPEQLMKKMVYVAENLESLNPVKRAARVVYEEHFTMSVFKKNLLSAMDDTMRNARKGEPCQK
jgi:GT2 family glycosyltransferase/2-polyprenyl-3-methyl-5-hydroxy-6-metoxy-1,4-benzoquinol methylase